MKPLMILMIPVMLGCGSRGPLPTTPTPPGDGGIDGPLVPSDGPPLDSPRPDAWVDPHRPPLPVTARCTSGWCMIPAGSFTMGSPPWEMCRNWSDTMETQHKVSLTHSYEIAATEVTQGQFGALMGYNPSSFTSCGQDCPVEHVRWHDAAAYCNALSAKNGLPPCYSCKASGSDVACTASQSIYGCAGYRLPTEAEWEFAYRAGTTSAYHSGDNNSCTGKDPKADAIGWYDLNAWQTIHPVAQKVPNAWGLYDMAGNTLEWTHDSCHKDLGSGAAVDPEPAATSNGRVLKGGSWLSFVRQLRGAYRTCGLAHTHSYLTGFRCVRMTQ